MCVYCWQVRRAVTPSALGDAVESNIYRRKQTSPIDKVQQIFRRRSLRMETDDVDSGASKRVSAPVLATNSEVHVLNVLSTNTVSFHLHSPA